MRPSRLPRIRPGLIQATRDKAMPVADSESGARESGRIGAGARGESTATVTRLLD